MDVESGKAEVFERLLTGQVGTVMARPLGWAAEMLGETGPTKGRWEMPLEGIAPIALWERIRRGRGKEGGSGGKF